MGRRTLGAKAKEPLQVRIDSVILEALDGIVKSQRLKKVEVVEHVLKLGLAEFYKNGRAIKACENTEESFAMYSGSDRDFIDGTKIVSLVEFYAGNAQDIIRNYLQDRFSGRWQVNLRNMIEKKGGNAAVRFTAVQVIG